MKTLCRESINILIWYYIKNRLVYLGHIRDSNLIELKNYIEDFLEMHPQITDFIISTDTEGFKEKFSQYSQHQITDYKIVQIEYWKNEVEVFGVTIEDFMRGKY